MKQITQKISELESTDYGCYLLTLLDALPKAHRRDFFETYTMMANGHWYRHYGDTKACYIEKIIGKYFTTYLSDDYYDYDDDDEEWDAEYYRKRLKEFKELCNKNNVGNNSDNNSNNKDQKLKEIQESETPCGHIDFHKWNNMTIKQQNKYCNKCNDKCRHYKIYVGENRKPIGNEIAKKSKVYSGGITDFLQDINGNLRVNKVNDDYTKFKKLQKRVENRK